MSKEDERISNEWFSLLDIYPNMIRDSCIKVNEVFKDLGLDDKKLYEYVWEDMEMQGLKDISSTLISILFRNALSIIEEKYPDKEVDYYINGDYDTHFYIDGEEW